MREVKEGDRVFHYIAGEIRAISIAMSNCIEEKKPSSMHGYDQWEEEGYLVHLEYHELEFALKVRDHFSEIQSFLPVKYSAFQNNGQGNQGYLYPCNEELAIKLLELIGNDNAYQVDEEQMELAIGIVINKEQNNLVPVVLETEAEAKRKIRIGQEKFKASLAPLWHHICALCGIELAALLRASHAKPWKDSDNLERLDSYNGLLLCCNHDALFDKGYITFDGTGLIHISPQIPSSDYGIYGIHHKMKIMRYEENKQYFRWHKKHTLILGLKLILN